ncbi:recombinase family protein [Orrella sp. 11846]|uniref:recombinase family protein n=1 Tax=Orrella sp. 11846 TaxID=3409913 RepID=UPI003B5ACFE6
MTKTQSKPVRKRCAVYCRVSTDERLDQEFNSIDAQKEACHAYVASQRAEGWIPVADDYDDPGFSGGNTDRPGLKRLMADIERGQIDIVVVYKIDRLTRSLADFSKMVEVFERQSVSFVSVTQQFNTTTSMGRLMLNVLLSFAQFEREVTGERIRDKIALSKKKGMWMGGTPPLGYDVIARKLVVNDKEAALVRQIFDDMVVLESTAALARKLNAEGHTTKSWITKKGIHRQGGPLSAQYLHKLLNNRIYLGELSLKGEWFAGEHEAIVDQDAWEKVQAVFAVNGEDRRQKTGIRFRTDSLLRGLLYAPDGQRLGSSFTTKNAGKRYLYYVTPRPVTFGEVVNKKLRIPSKQIEGVVVAQIKSVLSSPEALQALVGEGDAVNLDEGTVVVAMADLERMWDHLYPAEQHRLVNLMIERVDLVDDGRVQGVEISWRELGWRELLSEFADNTIGAEALEVE